MVTCVWADVSSAQVPLVANGIADFSSHSGPFTSAELRGQWAVAWDELGVPLRHIDDYQSLVEVPGAWPGERGSRFLATYGVDIILPAESQDLALLTGAIFNAAEIFVNGVSIGRRGQPATSLENVTPKLGLELFRIPNGLREIHLSVHISNFQNNRSGIFYSPKIGTLEILAAEKTRRELTNAMFVALLFAFALTNLSLFLFRPKFKFPLYAGLSCLGMSVFFSTLDAAIIYQVLPGISWSLVGRLTLLSWLVLAPMTLLLAGDLYPDGRRQRSYRVALAVSILFCGMGLTFPHTVLAPIYPIFHLLALVVIFGVVPWVFTPLVRAEGLSKRTRWLVVLYALLLLLGTVNDVLNNRNVIQTFFATPWSATLSSFLLTIYVSRRLARDQESALEAARAAQQKEHQALELEKSLRQNLQYEVNLQTVELREALASLEAAQGQLLQQSRMATVGSLASGMAHEIGNPLNLARGGAEELQAFFQDLKAQGPQEAGADIDLAEHYCKIILRGSERIETILRHLNQLAQTGDKAEGEACDVARVIESTIEIATHQLHAKAVTVETDLEPGLMVWMNRSELSQVVLNLVINAIHALSNDGVISLRTAAERNEVLISVHDTGPGVPKELREKIFAPFFTTKPQGEGTGLGLAMSAQMIADAGGVLSLVDSEFGAHFQVRLPISEGKH